MSAVRELSGTTLKGYHLGECLGSTSHTAVYRARRAGAVWAVKVVDNELAPDGALADRLQREAGVLAEVGCPSILPIQEAGRSGKMTYAVSPLVEGRSLRDLMRSGELDDERAWSVVSCVAETLDVAHPHGLVCRVLKPANVLLDEGRVYLAEFGVASERVGRLAMAAAGYEVSTPQYLAPEQVEGRDPDWRADIYALAVLIFEMLTGTTLLDARSPHEAMRATLDGSPPSASERQPALPAGLDGVLARALARDPELRQRSAGDLLAQLVTVPDDRPAEPPPASTEPVPAGPAPRLPTPDSSLVAVMRRMGVPVLRARHEVLLNSYFAALVRHARQVCGAHWQAVARASGLDAYVEQDPPDDSGRTASVASVSRLAEGIESVFGMSAVEVLRQWGRLTTEFWTSRTQRLQEGEVTYMRPFRLWSSADRKVEDIVYVFARNLERIRGEPLAAWKKIDRRHIWVVLYDNLTAVGRRREGKACHMWTAALEQTLRWGGAANQWVVDEAECGCVTGTYDCVFTIEHVDL